MRGSRIRRRVPQHAAATQTLRRDAGCGAAAPHPADNGVKTHWVLCKWSHYIEGQVTSGRIFVTVLFLFIQSIQGRLTLERNIEYKKKKKT